MRRRVPAADARQPARRHDAREDRVTEHLAELLPRRAIHTGRRLRKRQPRRAHCAARSGGTCSRNTTSSFRRARTRRSPTSPARRRSSCRRASRSLSLPGRGGGGGGGGGGAGGSRGDTTRAGRGDSTRATVPAPPPAPVVPLPTSMSIMGPIFQDEKFWRSPMRSSRRPTFTKSGRRSSCNRHGTAGGHGTPRHKIRGTSATIHRIRSYRVSRVPRPVSLSPVPCQTYKSPTPPREHVVGSWCLKDVRGDETLSPRRR